MTSDIMLSVNVQVCPKCRRTMTPSRYDYGDFECICGKIVYGKINQPLPVEQKRMRSGRS